MIDIAETFPYNLASVCMLWRDVLATVPTYWTNVQVDYMKGHRPSLTEVAAFFMYSQNLLITILSGWVVALLILTKKGHGSEPSWTS